MTTDLAIPSVTFTRNELMALDGIAMYLSLMDDDKYTDAIAYLIPQIHIHGDRLRPLFYRNELNISRGDLRVEIIHTMAMAKKAGWI